MEQRLTIFTLGVKNLQGMTAFYETKFNWEKSKDSNDSITFFKLNGILLSLYPEEELLKDSGSETQQSGSSNFTFAQILRSKEEVNKTIEELRAKGVKIVKEPEEAFWGGYSSYVSDLEGNLWEIAFNPFLNLDDAGNAM